MKYEIQIPQIKIDANFVTKLGLDQVLAQEVNTVPARILQDTTNGKQANGGSLKAYSPKYVEAIKRGWVRGHNGVRKVLTRTNLTITQDLLRSLAMRRTPDGMGVEIYFEGMHKVKPPDEEGKTRKRTSGGKRKSGGGAGAKSNKVRAASGGGAKLGFGDSGRLDRVREFRQRTKRATEIPHAALAQHLMDLGFTGWMSFSRKDIDRIVAALKKRVGEQAARLIDIRNR